MPRTSPRGLNSVAAIRSRADSGGRKPVSASPSGAVTSRRTNRSSGSPVAASRYQPVRMNDTSEYRCAVPGGVSGAVDRTRSRRSAADTSRTGTPAGSPAVWVSRWRRVTVSAAVYPGR
nr:hypothetical protein [Stackebrandtia albiflava]